MSSSDRRSTTRSRSRSGREGQRVERWRQGSRRGRKREGQWEQARQCVHGKKEEGGAGLSSDLHLR